MQSLGSEICIELRAVFREEENFPWQKKEEERRRCKTGEVFELEFRIELRFSILRVKY